VVVVSGGNATHPENIRRTSEEQRTPHVSHHRNLALSCAWKTTLTETRPRFLLTKPILDTPILDTLVLGVKVALVVEVAENLLDCQFR
jgi:hypothetical protein